MRTRIGKIAVAFLLFTSCFGYGHTAEKRISFSTSSLSIADKLVKPDVVYFTCHDVAVHSPRVDCKKKKKVRGLVPVLYSKLSNSFIGSVRIDIVAFSPQSSYYFRSIPSNGKRGPPVCSFFA